jgi:hypothetical protein
MVTLAALTVLLLGQESRTEIIETPKPTAPVVGLLGRVPLCYQEHSYVAGSMVFRHRTATAFDLHAGTSGAVWVNREGESATVLRASGVAEYSGDVLLANRDFAIVKDGGERELVSSRGAEKIAPNPSWVEGSQLRLTPSGAVFLATYAEDRGFSTLEWKHGAWSELPNTSFPEAAFRPSFVVGDRLVGVLEKYFPESAGFGTFTNPPSTEFRNREENTPAVYADGRVKLLGLPDPYQEEYPIGLEIVPIIVKGQNSIWLATLDFPRYSPPQRTDFFLWQHDGKSWSLLFPKAITEIHYDTSAGTMLFTDGEKWYRNWKE